MRRAPPRVRSLNQRRSSGRCQGILPLSPMARLRDMATMAVMGGLNGDGGFDAGVRVVALEGEVFVAEAEEVAHGGVEPHGGQGARGAGELLVDLVEVVFVNVEVAKGVDEGARLEVGDLGDHHEEEGVAGDIKGDAEEEIGAALVELAVEPAVEDDELEEGVAGRQGHLLDFAGVPGGNDEAAAVGVAADLVDDVGDLVDVASVGGAPVAPLGPVNAAEVAIFVGPFVPDGDFIFPQVADVGAALEKPQELVDDRAEVEFLRGEEGKPVR